MFKDDSMKFIIYVLSIGVLIILIFCMLQIFVLEQDVPFLNNLGFNRDDNPDDYVYAEAPTTIIKDEKDYQAKFQTNVGTFTAELFEENSPNTVNNFVFLASEGYYDKVKVHRVLKDLLFQTGDRNTLTDNKANFGIGGPGYVISDEINWESLDLGSTKIQELVELKYTSTAGLISKPLQKYSLAMANSKPNSNGSQFFVVTANNGDPKLETLNGKHTVFGKVFEGFDTVDKINNIEVDISNKEAPIPYKDIIIERIDIVELVKL